MDENSNIAKLSLCPPSFLLSRRVFKLLPEEKIVTDEGSIVECLKPSSNSTASIEEKNDVRLSGVIDPGEDGTRKGGAEGDRRERGNSDEDRGHGKELLRAKICWVKAGHDVLHERGSFMLALLHKVRATVSTRVEDVCYQSLVMSLYPYITTIGSVCCFQCSTVSGSKGTVLQVEH